MAKSWKEYERHPISARYPDLKGAAWEDFLENIRNSKIPPTIMMFEGKILDGWQRFRACLELGIVPTFKVLNRKIDPEVYVEQQNDHRRHESVEMVCERRAARRARVAMMREEGASIRTIAKAEKMPESTVRSDLEASTAQGCAVAPKDGIIKGQDGRDYRSTRTRSATPKNGSEKWNLTKFQSTYGVLVREIDAFARAHGIENLQEIQALHKELYAWKWRFGKLHEARSKTPLPKNF